MLRVVRKQFDIDNGITVHPGDIVDISAWKHATALQEHGFIGETDATKETVDQNPPKAKSPASAKAAKPAHKAKKRSVLAGRPRVFTR
jgi:hypothetical protein